MSDVVDISVAKLGFDNREFINNVNMSIMAVDALKDSLTFDSKSFDSLTKAANNIDLSSIATNVESLSQRFSTFGIVGMTAIQRITNELMTLGGKLGSRSLVVVGVEHQTLVRQSSSLKVCLVSPKKALLSLI